MIICQLKNLRKLRVWGQMEKHAENSASKKNSLKEEELLEKQANQEAVSNIGIKQSLFVPIPCASRSLKRGECFLTNSIWNSRILPLKLEKLLYGIQAK